MLSELDNVVLIYLTLNVDSTILSKKIVNSTMNLINEICYQCEKKKHHVIVFIEYIIPPYTLGAMFTPQIQVLVKCEGQGPNSGSSF